MHNTSMPMVRKNLLDITYSKIKLISSRYILIFNEFVPSKSLQKVVFSY